MKNKQREHYGLTVSRLLKYVTSTYKFQFAMVCITIIISALANMAGPLFLMYLIDDFIVPLIGQTAPNFSGVLIAVCIMAGVYIVGVICTYIYNRLMVNIGQGVQRRIRDEMFVKMQMLPIKFFDTHAHGEIMSLYTNDIDTLRQMISQSIPQVLSSVVTVVTIFGVMIAVSVELSLIAVIMVIIMSIVTKVLAGKSGKQFIKQQNDLSTINGYIEEIMSGQKVVKVFNHEQEAEEQFSSLNNNLCDSATKANRYANVLMPSIANLGNLQYVLVAIFGGLMLISGYGALTIGKLASYLQFTSSFNMPFSQISQQVNSIVTALAGAKRLFALIDEVPETDNGTVTLVNVNDNDGELTESMNRTGKWAWKLADDRQPSLVPLRGEVKFSDVTFGYSEGISVLHNINLTAATSEKIAFVGSTGAGKTTITNLINRFYDIQGGQIEYDGIDISLIKKADLRRSLGVVLQDTHLFSGTIMENIRYGNLNATDDEVYSAAKLANADSFIQCLPNGYDTAITTAAEELSQGQRQLLAIARAAIADPPVLILDEATSSIDTATEAIVQSGMDKLMQGRTVFVIAHRLSTIRNSDKIEVLESGRIIEQGTHNELLNARGTYYRLYTGDLELT